MRAPRDRRRHGRLRACRERAAGAVDRTAPYRVLAMSLGAMVATAWAQRHPDEIERLVLINTSMRPFARMHERLRPAAWPALARRSRHAWTRRRCAASAIIHRADVQPPRHARRRSRRMERDSRAAAPVSAANALRQLCGGGALSRAATSRRVVRLLLLSSAADRLVDPVCSARIAARMGRGAREHPWAGHDLPHDDPAWIGEQVRAWLAHEAALHADRSAANGD